MADRAVTRTGKDVYHNITKLCGDWGSVSAANAITEIEYRFNTYYVPLNNGTRADIEVVNGPTGKYLRTDWDNTTRNNLDDLGDC